MHSSFRPVSLRLSLSDVAALAAATARTLADRWRCDRPQGFGFRLRLYAVAAKTELRWVDTAATAGIARNNLRD